MSVAAAVAPDDTVRVMIVDDSVVARGVVRRWLEAEPGLAVVATHRTGREAVDDVARAAPHVVVLDIEMPDMDGLTALPLLLKARPGVAVVMASTLTRRNADISLRCLALGASDVLPKPSAEAALAGDYRRDLVAKIRSLGEAVLRRELRGRGAGAAYVGSLRAAAAPKITRPAVVAAGLRPFSVTTPRAVAIGASTGGPQALAAVLRALAPAVGSIPVLITQHMPAGFTATLAEHLAAASGLPACEVADGDPIRRGVIHVAPGGRHFLVARDAGGAPVVRLSDDPPENYCRPSVDPMLRSAASVYGAGLLAVILTGMGSDGAKGVRAVVDGGGSALAQDEATSVVWGMPAAARATGQCSAILPLSEIGPKVARLIAGDRS